MSKLWGNSVKKLDASVVRSFPLFAQMPLSDIQDILDLARPRLVPAGQSVFEEGTEASHFHLLLDGHIRVERLTPDGDRVVSFHIPPGQLFGIAKALGRDVYPATAVAALECLVLVWPMNLWTKFSTEYAGFAQEASRTVGARVTEMHTRVLEMATQHVEQRVAAAILRMMQQNGRPTEDGIEIAFPITRKIVSDMTGSTLFTVSRLLSAWEREGVLVSRRKHIHVHNVAALERLAAGQS